MQTQPSTHQLRNFGFSVGGVFLALAVWPVIRHGRVPRLWLLLLAGLLLVPGLVLPGVLRGPYQVWMKFAHILGAINSRVILTVTYYLVFTPAAFITRMLGKDPMTRAFIASADTYRVPRQARSASHMKHQF
jgi:hypothetical protein